MAKSGVADRLSWRYPQSTLEETDRGWVARVLVVLFAFGGLLLLATLLFEGPAERDEGQLAQVAVAALAVATFILAGFNRLPLWFLRLAPAIGTLLVTLSILAAGAGAAAAYAMYMVWVVIAAAMFLDLRLILLHAGAAIAAYAFALAQLEGFDELDPLRLTMLAGTMLVLGLVTAGITGQFRRVLGQLEAAATTDPLTGVLNRRAFEEMFDVELERAARGQFGVGVVMVDLDGFKRFNDEHGHQAGDAALQRLSRALEEHTRAIDHVARVGGEEFAIVAPESSAAGTLALAERLRRAVEIEFSGPYGLTASCGVAAYPENGGNRTDLIGAADKALYEAKARGRNRAVASESKPQIRSSSVSG